MDRAEKVVLTYSGGVDAFVYILANQARSLMYSFVQGGSPT
jgi:argininosuccinate synthase